MKRVINFSGGKTSALMTILLKPTEDDIVLFTDTGREHPLTYKFIDDFEKHEGIKVHRTIYTNRNAPGLTGFDALLANKKDVPNVVHRGCTIVLKVKQARKYLKQLKVSQYESHIGFRHDEQNRILRHKERFDGVTTRFILDEMKVVKEDVNQFWLSKPYRLEIPSILGNCDGCFLKGKANLIRIFALYPELADKWIKDEKHGTYINGVTYKDLLHIAKSQKTLFDLESAIPAYDCSCTN